MKLKILLLLIFAIVSCCNSQSPDNILADGQQPQIAIDADGIVRVAFGNKDKIYCATSHDNGASFTSTQLVAEIKDMHLGMSRGPQLASSVNYSLITAIDKGGTVHSFQLNHKTNQWIESPGINDIPNSAPEGLMSVAADHHDNFYAVWLDIRNDRHNKILFSSKNGKASKWSKNVIVYKSPDSSVCECCRPGITTSQDKIFIMFRNLLNGYRDLYISSADLNASAFSVPEKLGDGTWKLSGCPMDGGAIAVDPEQRVHTVWQREGKIYYAQPQKPEEQIGAGRGCSIVVGKNPIVTWQDGKDLKLKHLNTNELTTIGTGSYLKAIITKDNKLLCIWENEDRILFKRL